MKALIKKYGIIWLYQKNIILNKMLKNLLKKINLELVKKVKKRKKF